MATGGAGLLFSTDGLKEKYYCPICGKLMVDACQTNCGHRFCKHCLDQLFDEERRNEIPAKCPEDGCKLILRSEDGTRYFPDRCFQKEVRQLRVRCPLEKCMWVGELGRLEDHCYNRHHSYTVKPTELARATHVMVDVKHAEATEAACHHLKKLVGDAFHTVEVLGEALLTQKHMNPVIRESADDKQQSDAQLTANLGQPAVHEHSSILKAPGSNFNKLMMCEVGPELDTSALTQLTQADQAMALMQGQQQAQLVVGVDPLKQSTNGVDQFGAAVSMQANGEKPTKWHGTSTEDTAAMKPSTEALPHLMTTASQHKANEIPPPLPPKSRCTASAHPKSLPSQNGPPCTPGLPSSTMNNCSTETMKSSASSVCHCSMCEIEKAQRELEAERKKHKNMQSILAKQLCLEEERPPSHPTLNEYESRQRLFSVPVKGHK